VIEGDSPSQYWIAVEFNAAGAGKMRAATRNHIGRPIAILLNGQVTAAPVLRSTIDSSARITGDFTKQEAQKIVAGMRLR
jgi:SecD/SecF fusion protein